MIVIGLGSGRTGTASLAKLVGSQRDAICFHELNPTCAVFEGNPQSVLNTIGEFGRIIAGGDQRLLTVDYARAVSAENYARLQHMTRPGLMGDIAYYYLMYVDDILALDPAVKFVCIKRDKQQVVESWLRKSSIARWRSLALADRLRAWLTRTPYHRSYNFWQRHDGSHWAPNPVWDGTFPKFQAATKRAAIEQYWEFYYEKAESHARRLPASFRIFDISAMSDRHGQREILDFIGIPEADMVLADAVHIHKSAGSAAPA